MVKECSEERLVSLTNNVALNFSYSVTIKESVNKIWLTLFKKFINNESSFIVVTQVSNLHIGIKGTFLIVGLNNFIVR